MLHDEGASRPYTLRMDFRNGLSPVTLMSLEHVLMQAMELLGADLGELQLLDAQGSLTVVAARGFEADAPDCGRRRSSAPETVWAQALRERRPVVADAAEDPECESFQGSWAKAGVRAVGSAPLIGDSGVTLGVLTACMRRPRRARSSELESLRQQGREAGRRVEWLLSR